MSLQQIDPSADAYDEASCPMADCDATLYITWTLSRAVYLTDTVSDLRDSSSAASARWEVSCSEGHVLLLPAGCNDDEVFGSEPHLEDGEFRDDLGRLRRLLGGQL